MGSEEVKVCQLYSYQNKSFIPCDKIFKKYDYVVFIQSDCHFCDRLIKNLNKSNYSWVPIVIHSKIDSAREKLVQLRYRGSAFYAHEAVTKEYFPVSIVPTTVRFNQRGDWLKTFQGYEGFKM